MFSDMKTDANNARELRREKAQFPLAHVTGVLFFLDLVFSTSLLSGGLARQIARKTSGKKNFPYLLKFCQLRRNSYNIIEIRHMPLVPTSSRS